MEETNVTDIEKNSYSNMSYRSLMRARVRGAEYGVEIPELKYPLTGSRHCGWGLKIMVILTGLMIAAMIGVLLWAMIAVMFPFIKATSEASDSLATINSLPIIGVLTGASTLIMWVVAIGFPVIALGVILSAISFLISLIRICNYRAEEKALGYLVGKVMTASLIYGLVASVGVIALMFFKLYIPAIVFIPVAIYTLALFGLLFAERKAGKAFIKTLPAEQQENIREYFKKIRLVYSHRELSKSNRKTSNIFNHKSKWAVLLEIIYQYIDVRAVYSNLKNSAYRQQTTAMGRRALTWWFNFVIVAAITLLAFWYFNSESLSFLTVIAVIVAIVFAVYAAILTIPMMLNCSIKQLCLNRKFIGWAALTLTLLSIAAVVGLGALILTL